MARHCLAGVACILALSVSEVLSSAPVTGKGGLVAPPVIRHEAVEYVPTQEFPQVEAEVESDEEDVESVRLYFRAAEYPDFYYVEMVPTEEEDTDLLVVRAILPMPASTTRELVYYIEATTVSRQTARTAQIATQVTSASVPGSYTGTNPNIVVGATRAGAPSMPPGFQSVGISGVVSASGAVSSAGGGAGTGTLVGAGAGVAAAVAGVAVLTTSDSDTGSGSGSGDGSTATITTTSTSSTTSTTTTSTIPASLSACFDTRPDPPTVAPNECRAPRSARKDS